MAMNKRPADFTARFRLEGVEQVKAKLNAAATHVKQSLDRIRNSPGGERMKKSFEGAQKSVETVNRRLQTLGVVARTAGTATNRSMLLAKRGVDLTTAAILKSTVALRAMSAAARNAAARVRGIVLRGSAMVTAAGAAMGGTAISASNKSAEAINSTRDRAGKLGMRTEQLDALTTISTRAGLDSGTTDTLLGKINEQLGHLPSDRRMAAIEKMATRFQRMSAAKKGQFLENMFGAENVDAGNRLMQEMSRNAGGLRAEMDRLRRGGLAVSAKDVRLADEYRRSVTGLREQFKALRLVIFRTFGPVINRWLAVFTRALERNRYTIVARMVRAYDRFIVVVRDLLKVFGNVETGWAVQHTWMYRVRDAFAALPRVIRLAIDWTVYLGRVITETFWKLHARAVEVFPVVKAEIIEAWQWLKQFGKDLRAVVEGRDGDVSQQNLWMIALRDQAIATVLMIVERFTALYSAIATIIGGIWSAWSDLVSGIQAAEFSQTESAFYNIGAAVRIVFDWVVELTQQLYKMIALGEDATGRFAWLNTIRDYVIDFYKHLEIAIGWLSSMINGLHDWLAQWGFDLKSTLLFLGLLSLSGAGGLLAATVSGLGSVIAMSGPWGAAFAFMGAATLAFYNLLKNSPINGWIQGLMDKLWMVEARAQQVTKWNDESLAMYGDKRGQAPVVPVADMRPNSTGVQRAPAPAPVDWDAIRNNPNKTQYHSARTPPPPTTTLNLTVGNRTIETQTTTPASEVESAVRAANARPK